MRFTKNQYQRIERILELYRHHSGGYNVLDGITEEPIEYNEERVIFEIEKVINDQK